MTTAIATASDRTPPRPPARATRRKRDREPRIPARVRQAIALLATGECKTQRAAAIRVNLGEQHLSRMLNREQIRAFLIRESQRTIATAGIRAANRLVELIGAESEAVAFKAAERIAVNEGILKPDQQHVAVSAALSVGFVVDLSGARVTPHEPHDASKLLIEQQAIRQDEPDR